MQIKVLLLNGGFNMVQEVEKCPMCGNSLIYITTQYQDDNNVTTFEFVKECRLCNWKSKPLISKTYTYDYEFPIFSSWDGPSYNSSDPCYLCSNNPKNGGSGICHCILGSKVFY